MKITNREREVGQELGGQTCCELFQKKLKTPNFLKIYETKNLQNMQSLYFKRKLRQV